MRTQGSPEHWERQRFRAVALLAAGHRPSQVARQLGVAPSTVSQWKRIVHDQGPSGLRSKPHPGPSPKLTDQQRQKLPSLLLKGATAHGYRNALWTLPRVAEVIRKQFGVSYDPSSVWHILRDLGWSCQKPERRARERDEPAIARWRKRKWPHIKKRRAKRP